MVESTESRKIVLIGLDNSGKTSIMYNLKGIKNLPKYSEINPTKGENIETFESFDTKFSIWDLGGQNTYRESYLEDANRIFNECNKLIYVFDIQDIQRYDLAIEYYGKVIDLLETAEEVNNVDISIFLHKYDPDLKITRPEITEEIVNDFIERIKERIEKTNFFYQIFKTTIYAFFEKSIVD
ncbi:MAG: ADP-ribosylation factor-like protein [Candidatus Hermodarchaeota archaeon]